MVVSMKVKSIKVMPIKIISINQDLYLSYIDMAIDTAFDYIDQNRINECRIYDCRIYESRMNQRNTNTVSRSY